MLIAFFFVRLYVESQPAFDQSGFIGFVFTNDWDAVEEHLRRAGRCVVGTLITSAIALAHRRAGRGRRPRSTSPSCAPRRCAAPLTILVELLAAVPSVVYGLWGIFVLIPKLKPAEQWFSDTFSFLPFVGGHGRRARTTSSPG